MSDDTSDDAVGKEGYVQPSHEDLMLGMQSPSSSQISGSLV